MLPILDGFEVLRLLRKQSAIPVIMLTARTAPHDRIIASPLRALVSTLDRLGRGDLTARVNSRRRDEIGELGAAFDRMAERIGTLLTSERRLLQDVSHELRPPLARLSFAAELAGTAENRGAAVSRLKKELQRLTDLVDALLQTIQAGGEPLAITEEDVELSFPWLKSSKIESRGGRSRMQRCFKWAGNNYTRRTRTTTSSDRKRSA